MVAPLAGIRVLEVANWLAAPSAAALMADLGADVVKVEPPGGDAYRHSATRGRPANATVPSTYAFETDNRGKRSLTADLNQPAGRDMVRRLAQDCDIFITNLVERRREAFGLTPDALRAVNPRLIYVSFSAYGSEGPDRDRLAFDHSAFWARSGIMSLIGGPDMPPSMCRGGQGDHTTALNLLASTLVALRLRDLTGEGQQVEVSLIGTGAWTIATDMSDALQSGRQPQRHDRTKPVNPIQNTYRCRDGRWFLFTMSVSDPYWPRVCRAVGRPDLIDDPRFATTQLRRENSAAAVAILEEIFAGEDLEAWAPRFDEAGLIWAPVRELPEVFEDPTMQLIDAFAEVPDSHIGPYRIMNTPFRVLGADIGVRGPAPAPGEHTYEVLAERGFSADDIAKLAEQGVFG